MTVSVIIPTYNRSVLVQHAIDSILNQTYKNIEIIVIDDGSTDNTEEVLRHYGKKIKYIKQKNQGVNASRNIALSMCSGKYIALLDNDDLWLDFKIELEVEILETYNQAAFVFSDFYIFKTNGPRRPKGLNSWFQQPYNWDTVFSNSVNYPPLITSEHISGQVNKPFKVYFGDIYHISLMDPVVLPSTSLIRRSAIDDDIRFIEHDSICGDWDFFARLSHRYSAAYIDIETTLNRSHEDIVRLTRTGTKEQINMRLEMIHRIWESDTDYAASHKDNMNSVKYDLLTRLLKHSLSISDMHEAKQVVKKLNKLKPAKTTFKGLLLTVLVYSPGFQLIYQFVRKIKHFLS
ncbi:MAG: glycosyltransferase [Gammaproteobacteria bacterium]|nr:glycosyltransferase [Gammaproteobacteria bacterium]